MFAGDTCSDLTHCAYTAKFSITVPCNQIDSPEAERTQYLSTSSIPYTFTIASAISDSSIYCQYNTKSILFNDRKRGWWDWDGWIEDT